MQQIAKPTYKTITFRNLAFALYLVIGGAVFQLFEKQNYISTGKRYRQMIESFQRRYNITSKDMQNLEQDILHYGKSSAATEWSYSNAVLFAGTTVLTVGELTLNSSPKCLLGDIRWRRCFLGNISLGI